MPSNNGKLIAVIGATGKQGGVVVRALQAGGQFKVRALSRHPSEHRGLADEIVEADLDRPETLTSSNRQPRPYMLPRMPGSNTLSGQRCLM